MKQEVKLENGKLSDRDVKQYKDTGFLFPIGIFSPPEAQMLRTELEEM